MQADLREEQGENREAFLKFQSLDQNHRLMEALYRGTERRWHFLLNLM